MSTAQSTTPPRAGNRGAHSDAAFDARAIANRYMSRFEVAMTAIDFDALCGVVEVLRAARDRGSGVFLAGNGGSAATASHWVNDLGKATKRSGRRPIRVQSLSDNVSWLTALANDEGYDRVYAGQLENFASPGDVLIVISASGNSPNLVCAVEVAARCGMTTVGLLGFDGGTLRTRVDEALWLPTAKGDYGVTETGHVLLADIITTCLMEDGVGASGAPPGERGQDL
jgi:D-sedoheptulose 7-phosphate isomerase